MQNLSAQKGQIIIVALVFIVVGTVIASMFFQFAGQNTVLSGREQLREKALHLADAGINRAIYELGLNSGWNGVAETTLGDGSYEVILVSSSGNNRVFEGIGYVPNKATPKAKRRIRITLTNGDGASFSYGVQAGRGGFSMQNTSQVNGSIYSNGNITGNNSPVITGDAFAAGTSTISGMPSIGGNAYAHGIDNSTITGNASATVAIGTSTTVTGSAHADQLRDCTVNGNAYYHTSISSCTVSGSTSTTTAPTDLPDVALPVSDAQIADWETDAQNGGTHSSPCPYTISSGTTTTGPLKINCDFTISNTAVVTMTGTIWVVGNFTIQNSAILQLSSSTYGSNGGIFIVDNPSSSSTSGTVSVNNSAQLLGAGPTSSYLMVISMNTSAENGGNTTAIDVGNTGQGSIYYAPHGEIAISNSNTLREATAYLMSMRNSAALTYQSGLANSNFTSGPTGGWSIKSGSWHITE